jgi:CheY-like chemotaxis protein
MVQVLLNLTMNARDAMPAGGRVTISTCLANDVPEGGRFGRRWECEGAATLIVADTGTGIDPAITARVFEPFFTTKPTGQGTGLGLSVVEGIVEQSNGEMWLDSRPGQGTRFVIALPLVEAAEEEAGEPAPPPGGGTETILLVDDEAAVREVLARGLRENGYRLIEASSGSEALEILGRSADDIDLVVTDVAMPEMSGIELAHRALERSGFLPFIFLSGQPKEVLPDFGPLAENHELLEKPFPPDVLGAAVRARLDRRLASPEKKLDELSSR